jgi:LuxR family maltose regulon positive regulatory protein
MAHVGLAQVLYERDELDAAVDHATRGVELCRHLAFTQPLATGLALLARIRQAQGDPAGAQEAIRQAERVELSPQIAALLNPVPVQTARLALASGEGAEAARWVQQRGLGADDELDYPREGEYLVLARVLLAQQEPERALGLLQRLHAQAMAQGRTGSLIELRTLQALTLDATDDRPAALDALAEALTMAGPEGHVRVFVDEGATMASLLNRLAAAHRTGRAPLPGTVRPDDLERLLHAFQPGAPRAGRHPKRDRAAGPGPVELLSDRELEVLGLLAAGKSNPEIAEELVVVIDTVKKHVGHILDKLGAANRTQAVARARALGLLR